MLKLALHSIFKIFLWLFCQLKLSQINSWNTELAFFWKLHLFGKGLRPTAGFAQGQLPAQLG